MCSVGRTKDEHHTAGVDLLKKIRFLATQRLKVELTKYKLANK